MIPHAFSVITLIYDINALKLEHTYIIHYHSVTCMWRNKCPLFCVSLFAYDSFY